MKVTIYTLSIGDNIFYVGKSSKDLKKRRQSHLSGMNGCPLYSYMQSLPKSERRKIEIIPIDECLPKEESWVEWYWIHQMQVWGFTLYNHAKVLRTSGMYHRKYPKKQIIEAVQKFAKDIKK